MTCLYNVIEEWIPSIDKFFKVSISDNEIVNTQTLHNLKIHYDILSTWSDADVKTIGSFMNFCGPDNPESEEYYSAANQNGLGCCNNRSVNKDPSATLNRYGYGDEGNTSRRLRMLNTSFDYYAAANATNTLSGSFINNGALATIGKNHVLNSSSTAQLVAPATEPIIYNIVATIPLKEIHSIFKNLHLTKKNMDMKLELNLNTNFTSLFTFTGPQAAPTYASYVNTGAPPCCPYVISPIGTSVGTTALNVTGLRNSITQNNFQTQLQIGKATVSGTTYINPTMTARRINVPLYTMSPSQEKKYLSAIPEIDLSRWESISEWFLNV